MKQFRFAEQGSTAEAPANVLAQLCTTFSDIDDVALNKNFEQLGAIVDLSIALKGLYELLEPEDWDCLTNRLGLTSIVVEVRVDYESNDEGSYLPVIYTREGLLEALSNTDDHVLLNPEDSSLFDKFECTWGSRVESAGLFYHATELAQFLSHKFGEARISLRIPITAFQKDMSALAAVSQVVVVSRN